MYLLERLSPSKRATHQDLVLERPPIRREVLGSMVERFRSLLTDPVEDGFRVLSEFAEELSRTGRETDSARQVREVLQGVDGVEGVKGCGAGLHDQFLMVLRPGVSRASVSVAVERAGLRIRGPLSECVW
jgi:hypothetical protein